MTAALPLRLAAFGAMAAFAAAHWASLVADPPLGRVLAVTAIACALAAALALLGDTRLPRGGALALGSAVAVASLALGLLAVGLGAGLLAPSGWQDLGQGIGQGLSGLGDAEVPYSGRNPWVRMAILLALPLALSLAAALAFWPGRRRRGGLALTLLIALYAVAATLHRPALPLLWGLVLLALVAAWLWLPGLERRAARGAAVALAAAGLLGLGAAALLDGEDPWLDWREWRWPGDEPAVSFRWNHSYGPIEWPREGTALLRAESEDPHYWRTIQLDRFDGLRWEVGTEDASIYRPLELPRQVEGAKAGAPNADWVERVTFTVGALDSGLLVAPGAVSQVDGLDGVSPGAGGTVLTSEKLNEGDEYTVTFYLPEPAPTLLREAPSRYPGVLRRYTQLELPRELPVPDANGGLTLNRPPALAAPLYGRPASPEVAAEIRRSLYADVYSLARRLSAGAPTTYDAVTAIEEHLRQNYAYDESPPARKVPLRAFLFGDRIGYCQQFSGAMALMLRSIGIPSRVAAGFSPGEREDGGAAFQVSDRDAHSWVEVYFNGIGWVSFDPTPSAAPAGSQLAELAGGRGAEPAGALVPRRGLVVPTVAGQITEPPGQAGGGLEGMLRPALSGTAGLAALMAVGLAALLTGRALRFRRLDPAAAAIAQTEELARALPRLGLPIPAGATLSELERRLSGRSALVGYLSALRGTRFERGRRPPGLGERRRVRRELGAESGLGGRLRALLELPPGSPR